MIKNENIGENPDRKYLKKGVRGFLPNNPGKPFGAICRSTRLKNEVLDILETRKEELKIMSIDKLLTVGASFVPKEIKGEGFADTSITNIFGGQEISSTERGELIKAIRERRGKGGSV